MQQKWDRYVVLCKNLHLLRSFPLIMTSPAEQLPRIERGCHHAALRRVQRIFEDLSPLSYAVAGTYAVHSH